jgi:hypothetical protein
VNDTINGVSLDFAAAAALSSPDAVERLTTISAKNNLLI